MEAARVILLSIAFVPLRASGFLAGKLATQRTLLHDPYLRQRSYTGSSRRVNP